MKFEFTMAVKAVPMADVRVNIDCSAEELSVMLSDPVYQDLGRALVAKLQQSNRPNRTNGNRQHQSDQHRQEAHQAQQKARDEAIMGLLKTINHQLDKLGRRQF